MRVPQPHVLIRVRAPLVPGGWVSGGEVRDWSAAVETELRGFVQPDREVEQSTDEQSVSTDLRTVLPPSADVVETDRLRWQGRTYEVLRVEPWSDRQGRPHHIEVAMRAVAYAVS